jgi:hypothetical protein
LVESSRSLEGTSDDYEGVTAAEFKAYGTGIKKLLFFPKTLFRLVIDRKLEVAVVHRGSIAIKRVIQLGEASGLCRFRSTHKRF